MQHIVTLGGGGFSEESDTPLLDDYILQVAGTPRPRVCFIPSASGDADSYVVRFYQAFGARAGAVSPLAWRAFRPDKGIGALPRVLFRPRC